MELQQIIEGLNCFKTNQHPCATCPWNPNPGMAWPYGCIKGQSDIIEAAQEQLRKRIGYSEGMKIIKEAESHRDNFLRRAAKYDSMIETIKQKMQSFKEK